MVRNLLAVLTVVLVLMLACAAYSQVFNCNGNFTTTNTSCGVGGLIAGSGAAFKVVGTQSGCNPSVSGGVVTVMCSSTSHGALSFAYQTKVNVQAFNTTFDFTTTGWVVAFMFNNSNNNPTFNGADFSAGAGCEGDFFQGFSQTNPPNNVFALNFDSYNPLINGNAFTYSSTQVYQSNVSGYGNIYIQCPCQPATESCGTNNSDTGMTKLSTSPVAMNSPSNSANTATGDTFEANLVYDGSSLTEKLFDVTAGGTCPGVNCYTNTWTGINIPNSVGANTAWVTIGASTGSSPILVNPVNVSKWSYTVMTPGPVSGGGVTGGGGMW